MGKVYLDNSDAHQNKDYHGLIAMQSLNALLTFNSFQHFAIFNIFVVFLHTSVSIW